MRILDFTRVLAGPLSTALLADLGAEVVKIEPPQGDDYRAIGPMNNGESALFTVMNRNKQSLVLDLKHPEAVALVHEMAAQADVVVENFRPGVAERLGIGASQLRALNPRLVYVSVSGFGQTGPLAHRPAYDIIVQAMSGLMEATGEPDGAPTVVGEAVSDVVAGLFASWATLAALLQARATGQGQQVDVAMFDTTLSFLATSVARYLFTGRPARRVGNRHPLSAPSACTAQATATSRWPCSTTSCSPPPCRPWSWAAWPATRALPATNHARPTNPCCARPSRPGPAAMKWRRWWPRWMRPACPPPPSGTLPRRWSRPRARRAACLARCRTLACPACACPPSPCISAAPHPTAPSAHRPWASTPTPCSRSGWAGAPKPLPRCAHPVPWARQARPLFPITLSEPP